MNCIKLRQNNLCVDNVSTLKLIKKFRTPFYCYSLSQIKENFFNFKNTFGSINPIICFSVKSNSNLSLLRELKKIGSGARQQMQKLINGKVYLELLVKVVPNWRSKPSRLAELGYEGQ